MPLTNLTRIARSSSDPRILSKGPSSLTGADRLARSLGWLSIAIGITELVAAPKIARGLGLHGNERLIRAYGVRELASAVPTLSVDSSVGLATRIVGDVLDLGTLVPALRGSNPKRGNAALAAAAVVAITALDVFAFAAVRSAHRRDRGERRNYSDRSGLPRGPEASRGLARDSFEIPPDYRAEGRLADIASRRSRGADAPNRDAG